MLLVKRIISFISDRFALYYIVTLLFQLFGAFVIAVASPLLLRKLFLPALLEYTVPLHFNFETCHEQLAGVCSFPTATVDFSVVENPKLSPGESYEMNVEIVLSESATASSIGIFQAVVEFVDQMNEKRTYRRSCFPSKRHGLIYRISQGWWNLLCQTVFFPAYFFGLLTMLDDRKLEVSFTDRLVTSDLAKVATLHVQLQNRFIEVESGKLSLRTHFGLLRVLLRDYPIVSSLLIIIFIYLMCLTGIALYWTLKVLFGFCGLANLSRAVVVDETRRSSSQPELHMETTSAKLDNMKGSEIAVATTILTWNDSKTSGSDIASENHLHRRQQSALTKY